ncbi:MAG: GNAT family N-acetyltransferase [Candidatus Omnitrophota bacterium]
MMNYRWIENIGDYEKIGAEWDRALFASGEDNPFLLSDFITTWWKHFGARLGLRIFAVYDGDRIVGGLPLCSNKAGRFEHVGAINANYTEWLSTGDVSCLWAVLCEALSNRGDWRLIHLARYRKDKLWPDLSVLGGAAQKDKTLFDAFPGDKTYIVDIPGNFTGYDEHLPKKLRYYVRRSIKEFSGLGKVSLNALTEASETEKAAGLFMDFSRRSFGSRGMESAFDNSAYRAYFLELTAKMLKAGFLQAHTLKVNDRVAAIHFGFSIGNNLNYVFTTYDIDLAGLNPGHLLIYKLVEAGSLKGKKEFDMYPGRKLYKEQWADRAGETFMIELRPDTMAGRMDRLITGAIRSSGILKKTKDMIKSVRPLRRAADRVRNAVKDYV